jgi:transposase
MKNIPINPVRLITVVALVVYNINSKEIQEKVHVSKSVVSRHILGERECSEINIYIIEKIFNIKIKEYEKVE